MASPLNLSPGNVLASRYRILGILGRGGMGTVYRADDLKLGQTVALKFLPPSFKQNPDLVERFHAEVRTARQVSHPNVCRVYDIGEVDGNYFLTMEYVDGEDLATLLSRIGRLPSAKALEISHELCAGLAAAHARGVIHRDLKPANIMIDGRGHARINDFGLAIDTLENKPGEIAGTPAYMAPELYEGKTANAQSDLYALGLVMYELYTGKRPWNEESVSDWRKKHSREQPPAPSSRAADINPAVEGVILRCLEKKPESRPRSALKVASMLPGGSPLAAALAAGETPSPEMVAAAGEEGALSAGKAWILVSAVAIFLFLICFLSQRDTLLNLLPADKPPEVLSAEARRIASELGYNQPSADSVYWFHVDSAFRSYISKIPAPGRFRDLAAAFPSPLNFWYRESPRPLATTDPYRVTENNPPLFYSGEWMIGLDSAGRFQYFSAIGPEQNVATATENQVDWQSLFRDAGLDLAQAHPVTSIWLPDVPTDKNFSWEESVEQKNVSIQAGTYHGKAVFFHVLAPWAVAKRVRPVENTFAVRVGLGIFVTLALALNVLCFFFARKNLKMGRGDWKGALLAALTMLTLNVVGYILYPHFTPDSEWIWTWANGVLGLAAATSLEFGAVYLALEPYVRRRWPELLISWSRLLAGNWRDALVGRDVLLGVLFGTGMILALHIPAALPYWFNISGLTPYHWSDSNIREPRAFLAIAFFAITQVMMAVGTLLLTFLVARLTRSKTAGIIFATLVVIVINFRGENLKLEAGFVVLMAVLAMVCLMRVGFLSACIAWFLTELLTVQVITTDFSRWYAWRGALIIAIPMVMAIYGFKVALGGKPMFGTVLED